MSGPRPQLTSIANRELLLSLEHSSPAQRPEEQMSAGSEKQYHLAVEKGGNVRKHRSTFKSRRGRGSGEFWLD
jgi:hypothetical protein